MNPLLILSKYYYSKTFVNLLSSPSFIIPIINYLVIILT